MKKRVMFAVAWFLLLAGCSTPQEKALKQQRELVSQISYFEDERVGVCYAYLAPSSKEQTGSLTEVACDRVRPLLPRSQAVPSGAFRTTDVPPGGVLTMRDR